MTHVVLAWAPASLWAAVLFVLSSRPSIPAPQIAGLDKVAHLVLYTIFGALLAWGARRAGTPVGWAAAAGLLYGASDEWHQSFVPGRDSSTADWIADAVGIIVGIVLYQFWRARQIRTA